MAQISARDLMHRWPALLTLGIVAFLVATTIHLPHHLPFQASSDNGSAPNHSFAPTPSTTTKTTTQKSTTTPAAGQMAVQVLSFRLNKPDSPASLPNVNMTLQIRNRAKDTTTFHPTDLTLRSGRSELSINPGSTSTKGVLITHNVPLLFPVAFKLTSAGSTSYELAYQGKVVFTGQPSR